MPHPARPSIHAKPSKGKKGNGRRSIPDFSGKPKPKLKPTPTTAAKSSKRGK